jgi:hypothetical protein
MRLTAGLALAASCPFAAGVAPGGIAGAAVQSVSCAGLRSDATGSTFFVSRCTGGGRSVTGGTGTQSIPTASQSQVTWKSGMPSVLTFTTTLLADNCPNGTGCARFGEVSHSGTVTGGTATGLVGSSCSGTICGYTAIR